MAASKDCWTPVLARSTKKTMMAAGTTPGKNTTGLIKAHTVVAAPPSSYTSTGHTLDPDDFPALPKRSKETAVRTEQARCWRKREEESTQVIENSGSDSFTEDVMYPCLVDTVNAVLASEDAIPKTETSTSHIETTCPGQISCHETGKTVDEKDTGQEGIFEVVPGLTFAYRAKNEGSDFLERNAYRLFFGSKSLQRKRNQSRYAFCH